MPAFLLAEIGVPTAGQCLEFLGPLAGLVMLGWLFRNSEQLVHRLLPHLEWERKLGWLNIRAERRATAALRYLGYAIYALLAGALGGILWGAIGLSRIRHGSDPQVLRDLSDRLPVLVACGGFWAVYLGIDLLPRLRREYELEELDRYRAELAELGSEDQAHAATRTSKAHSPTQISLLPRSHSKR